MGLHLVAAEIVLAQVLQLLTQFFGGHAIADGRGQLAGLQDFLLDKDGAIHAQGEGQRVGRPGIDADGFPA